MHVDWKQLIKTLAPIIIPIVAPKAAVAVPFIVHGIEVAESIGGTGQEKLAKAIELTNVGIQATNQIAGHEVINTDATNAAIAAGISAVVNAANVVHRQDTPASK